MNISCQLLTVNDQSPQASFALSFLDASHSQSDLCDRKQIHTQLVTTNDAPIFSAMSIFSSLMVLLLILVEAAPPTASSVPTLGELWKATGFL